MSLGGYIRRLPSVCYTGSKEGDCEYDWGDTVRYVDIYTVLEWTVLVSINVVDHALLVALT